MRSPFAETRTRTPTPAPRAPQPVVEVSLEEDALFDLPKPRKKPSQQPALQRVVTGPPPRRSVPPPAEHETTTKHTVNPALIQAIREGDSTRLHQAIRAAVAVDLSKTSEEPMMCDFTETSSVRRTE